MNYKLLLDTAVLAGEIMLKSGAETYRVEDTISRILKTSCLKKTEAFVMPTGLFATLDDKTIDSLTVIKRIEERETNLNNIYQVNTISRRYCNGEISLEVAFQELKRMNTKQYNNIMLNIAIILVSASFALLLGGSWPDALGAGLSGAVLCGLIHIGKKLKMNGVIQDLLCSIGCAISAVLISRFLPIAVDVDMIIIGTIMPMVPGVAITNAIRDTLQGDYVSGCAKILEAFVKALAIAIGVGVGIAIMGGIK
jgi:Uncharacterized conserved protein